MKNFLLKVDFLSPGPVLNTFNMKRYQNMIGTFLSILTGLVMSAFTIYFSYHTFSRQRVNININDENNDNPTKINFSENPIIIWIYSSTGLMICDYENYMNIRMGFLQLNETSKDFDLNEKKVVKNKDLLLNEPNSDKEWLKCGVVLDTNDPANKDLLLYGQFGTPYANSVLAPYANRCVNSTENGNQCTTEQEIDEFTKNFYIVIGIYSYAFDSKNFTYPGTKFFNTYAYPVGSKLFREVVVRFKEVQFITDTGFVFEDLRTEKFFEMTDAVVNYNLGEDNSLFPRNFVRIWFMHHPKVTKNYRTYAKIQDLVANVGGVIKGIIVAATLLDYYFVKAIYTAALGRYLLNQEICQDKEKLGMILIDDHKSEISRVNNYFLNFTKTKEVEFSG